MNRGPAARQPEFLSSCRNAELVIRSPPQNEARADCMTAWRPNHFLIVGAGAAGLMIARELARGGRRVTVVEARQRCGGRIDPLPVEAFGYPAEGGAEFVHGSARVTRGLMRE